MKGHQQREGTCPCCSGSVVRRLDHPYIWITESWTTNCLIVCKAKAAIKPTTCLNLIILELAPEIICHTYLRKVISDFSSQHEPALAGKHHPGAPELEGASNIDLVSCFHPKHPVHPATEEKNSCCVHSQAVAYEYQTEFAPVLSERMQFYGTNSQADTLNRVKVRAPSFYASACTIMKLRCCSKSQIAMLLPGAATKYKSSSEVVQILNLLTPVTTAMLFPSPESAERSVQTHGEA